MEEAFANSHAPSDSDSSIRAVDDRKQTGQLDAASQPTMSSYPGSYHIHVAARWEGPLIERH